MSDNIIFERIWEDTSFFEVKVTCQSESVCATTKIYVDNEAINALCQKINDVVSQSTAKAFWQAGERGNETTPSMSFDFACDGSGHVIIDVYMELDDGGELSAHNCAFYVNTEVGLLENFSRKLQSIKNAGLGSKAELFE